MNYGLLNPLPALENLNFLSLPTQEKIKQLNSPEILAVEIDSSLSDTAAFCEHYQIPLERAANCVVLEASRGDKIWYAAALVLANTRADVNGIIRRHLDARRVSFAPMETALKLTTMEYGGITPIGLPEDWPVLIDSRVAASDWVTVGSGIRGSKIILPGKILAALPSAQVLENMAKQIG